MSYSLGWPGRPRQLDDNFDSGPALPGLAGRLAREEYALKVPVFQLPRIDFNHGVTLQGLINIAQNSTQAPFDELWAVWGIDHNHRVPLHSILSQLAQEVGGDVEPSQIYLVRQNEFDHQRQHLLCFIQDRFGEAYDSHYKVQYEHQYGSYIRQLESLLKKAPAEIAALQSSYRKLLLTKTRLRDHNKDLQEQVKALTEQLRTIELAQYSKFGGNDQGQLREQHLFKMTQNHPISEFEAESSLFHSFQANLSEVNTPRTSTSLADLPRSTRSRVEITEPVGTLERHKVQNVGNLENLARVPMASETSPLKNHKYSSVRASPVFSIQSDSEFNEEFHPRNSAPLLEEIQKTISHNPFDGPEPVMAPPPTCIPAPATEQTLGKIVDEDEVGPIYDYTHLVVGLRGGAGSPDELEDSEFANTCSSRNAGFNQRVQKLLEDDDEVDSAPPATFNGVLISAPWPAEVSHRSNVAADFKSAMGSHSSDFTRGRNQERGHSSSRRRNRSSRRYGSRRQSARGRQFAPAFANIGESNQNENLSRIDYFRPLSGNSSFADTPSESGSLAYSSAFVEEADNSHLDPLRMIFADVSNSASVEDSMNSTRQSSLSCGESVAGQNHAGNLIEPIIQAQALRNDELHLARSPMTEFEKANSQYKSRNTGKIIQHIGGTEIIYEPKIDKRLRNVDGDGNYLGGAHNMPKKRQLMGLKEQIKERHRQLIQKSQEYRYFCSLSKEDRAWLWEKRNAPMQYWQGRPGADFDDLVEIDQIPEQYVNAYKRYKKRQGNRSRKSKSTSGLCEPSGLYTSAGSRLYQPAPSLVAQSYTESIREFVFGSNQEFNDDTSSRYGSAPPSSVDATEFTQKSISGVSDKRSTVKGSVVSHSTLRTDEEVLRMLRDIFLSQDRFPAPGSTASQDSRPCPSISTPSSRIQSVRSEASHRTSTGRATGEPDDVFLTEYDGPELEEPKDVEFSAQSTSDDPQDDYRTALNINKENPRAVLVTLHPGPRYSPGALTKRLFGGIIQEIQLHERDRAAIVVFLYAPEATGFIEHINKVKRYGLHQEIASLQIEVDWYKGNTGEAVVEPQPEILRHAIFNNATRALRIKNLRLDVSREIIFADLNVRLGKLLASISLVTPKQRYKQKEDGRQAIIEFVSIKDAMESRQALLDGKIQDFLDCEPEFEADPALAGENFQEKKYCSCLECRNCRADGEVNERK